MVNSLEAQIAAGKALDSELLAVESSINQEEMTLDKKVVENCSTVAKQLADTIKEARKKQKALKQLLAV